MESSKPHVIVIGAGVIGLQTAVTLLEAGYAISIIAEFWPGQKQAMYTSDWAGAHWRTHASAEDKEMCDWDTQTYRAWTEMVEKEKRDAREGESGLGICTSFHYWDKPTPETADGASSLWWSSTVSDFKVIPSFQLPSGAMFGVSFSTFAINVPQYLKYLLARVKALGGMFFSARLSAEGGLGNALEEAQIIVGRKPPHAYVNATGIAAKQLAHDEAVTSQRGQTVVVKGEARSIVTRLGKTKDDIRVVIPRPYSGTSIIGVTKEASIWDTEVNKVSKQKTLRECKELASELLMENGEFEVLDVQVGLRPARSGGPRVEAEVLDSGKFVIHENGHGGAGYQNSIGSANKVLQILQQHAKAKI